MLHNYRYDIWTCVTSLKELMRTKNGSLLWILGTGDKALQEAMADSLHFRAVQREQLHAMDSIQYYSKYCNEVLQCLGLPSRYDEHDIYDYIYTVDIPR